jgi:hypothetical protein
MTGYDQFVHMRSIVRTMHGDDYEKQGIGRGWEHIVELAKVRWPPKTGQVAKRESSVGTAGWPEVRLVEYTEEAQSRV